MTVPGTRPMLEAVAASQLNCVRRRLAFVAEIFDHKSLVFLVVQLIVVFGWLWKGFVEPLQRVGAHVLRQEVFGCMPPGASCPSTVHFLVPFWSCRSNERRSLRSQPIMMGNFCRSTAWVSRLFSLDFVFKRRSRCSIVPKTFRGQCSVLRAHLVLSDQPPPRT